MPYQLKVKESEVTQWCPTLCDPMDYSLPGSSIRPWDFPGKSSGVPFPSPLSVTYLLNIMDYTDIVQISLRLPQAIPFWASLGNN